MILLTDYKSHKLALLLWENNKGMNQPIIMPTAPQKVNNTPTGKLID